MKNVSTSNCVPSKKALSSCPCIKDLPAKFTMMISLEKVRWISGRWIEGDWISAGGWNDDKGLYAVLVPGECMTTESGSLQIRCTLIPKTSCAHPKLRNFQHEACEYDDCQIKCPRIASVPFQVRPKHLSKRVSPIPLQSAANKVPSTSFLCLHPLLLYMVLDQDTIERSCRC